MNNFSCCKFTIPLFFVFPFCLVVTAAAQGQADIRDLVQMPVAVNKAAEAGIQQGEVESISRSLREGRVSPREFNQTMRDVSTVAAEKGPEGVREFGGQVSQQVRQGLRGQDLANSIHERLREQGIPAGGNRGQGPPPVARDYIPEQAKERIRQRGGAQGRPQHVGRGPEQKGTGGTQVPGRAEDAKGKQSPADSDSQKGRATPRGDDKGGKSSAEQSDQRPAERTQPASQRGGPDSRKGGGSGRGGGSGGGGSGGGGGSKGGR